MATTVQVIIYGGEHTVNNEIISCGVFLVFA
jgi:hypothetical protein